jgi:hypothetical protein
MSSGSPWTVASAAPALRSKKKKNKRLEMIIAVDFGMRRRKKSSTSHLENSITKSFHLSQEQHTQASLLQTPMK